MPYLPRTLPPPSGLPIHKDAHVGLHAAHDALYSGDELEIINVQAPPSAVTATGAVGNGTTDDTDAIQACFDYVKDSQSKARNHLIYFPPRNASGSTATYEVSAPLRVWTHTRIKGNEARIRASTSFSWVNHPYWQHANFKPVGDSTPGNIALMELWNIATTRYASSRIHLDWLELDCRSQAGSIGFMGKMQQNARLIDLQIENADTGFVCWGQQAKMERLQIGASTECKVGVFLGGNISGDGVFGDEDAKFFKFEELNVEYYTVAAIRMVADGPNWFNDSHFENLHAPLTPSARVVDWQSGEANFTNTWSTHRGDAVIVVGDKTPAPGIVKTTGNIRNWRNSDADLAYTKVFLDDRIRNKIRLVGSARNVEFLSLGFQNDTQTDYDALATWWGDEGGEVRIGGLKGGTSAPSGHTGAQFTVIPNTAQDEPSVRFTDSAKVLRAGITQNGNLFAGAFSNSTRGAITGGLVAGSQIWNTDDNAPNWWDGAAWRDAMGTVT